MTARAAGSVGERHGPPRAGARQERRGAERGEDRRRLGRSQERRGAGRNEERRGAGRGEEHRRTRRGEERGRGLVRGGSDPVLLRIGDVARAGRGSATSLPASLPLERGTPGQQRPRSGTGQGRVVRAGRVRMDARRRVRQTVGGSGEWRGEGAWQARLLPAPARSASLPAVTLTAPPRPSQPSAPPPAPSLSSTQVPSAPLRGAPAPATPTQAPAPAPAPVPSSGGEKAAPRPGRYGRSVSSLAAALRREDRRHHHKTSRRRHDRDAKSRKYVAGSGGGRQGPLAATVTHSHSLWRPVNQPPPDPVKPRPHAPCCCPPAMTTAPCSSLLLLPLHFLLLALLLAYLIIGAYVFSALEDPLGEVGGLVEVSRSTVTLPGTPRHPHMTSARQELVQRLINTSSDLILERSQEVVIAAIFTSSRIQSALQAFQQGGGARLPSDEQLERLSRSVMTEWRQQLHHLAARYHTLVTRHALGIQVDSEERAAVWEKEEPPPPLLWRPHHALLHAFCLVTTLGGGVHTQTPGGRVASVVFTVVGVVLYVAVVGVWAARLRDTVAIVVKMFSRKKIQAREAKNSPYDNMHAAALPSTPTQTTTASPPHFHHHLHHHSHPYHHPHALSALLILFVIILYIVSIGAQAVAGETFWAGLENSILALLCVRPPSPLPQDLGRISGFMAFAFVGHLLMALLLYSAKEWWWVWWRGRARAS